MKRVFPTQLRVVQEQSQLVTDEEIQKGYYDPSSKNSVRVGVNGTHAIYLSSPGNWYRNYVFTILKIPEEITHQTNEREEVERKGSDDYDVWRIVSQLIKTECGRKVIHRPGQKYVTLAGMNKDMAKQFYYLTKHTLTKMGVEFKLSYSIFSPFGSATPPDVRVKPKRKRHHTKKVQDVTPTWITVEK